MRRVEVESWEQLMAEEQASWDSVDAAASDDPGLEELLAVREEFEELHCGERELDHHRWELDPASAEDFGERDRFVRVVATARHDLDH